MSWTTIGPHRLYRGDWRDVYDDVMPGVAGVISDPPYGMDWNTDSKRFTGGGRIWGDGVDSRPVVGDKEPFDPAPFLSAPAVALFGCHHFASRLPVGSIGVWIKRRDANFGTFLSDAELAWFKGGHGVYCVRELQSNTTLVWEAGGAKGHPTQKPVAVMRWLIQRAKVKEGGVVFDPFMGSGSTGVAAAQLGYRFVGCEVDDEQPYFEIACRRMAKATRLPDPHEAEPVGALPFSDPPHGGKGGEG
ncbi:MAG: site-specific DNA-methyltransferase [Planctomycetota bacterium]